MRTAISPMKSDFHELAYHFLTLSAGDQLLRFGEVRSDRELAEYADTLLRRSEVVFLIMEPAPSIAGVVHLEFTDCGVLLGLSVSDWARGHGVGTELLDRAILFASSCGIGALYAHNLSTNAPLRCLALRIGLKVAWVPPDGSTRLDLPTGRTNLLTGRFTAGRILLADYSLRFQTEARQHAQSPAVDLLELTAS